MKKVYLLAAVMIFAAAISGCKKGEEAGTILTVKNLTKNFGGLCAVSNVSMTINEG